MQMYFLPQKSSPNVHEPNSARWGAYGEQALAHEDDERVDDGAESQTKVLVKKIATEEAEENVGKRVPSVKGCECGRGYFEVALKVLLNGARIVVAKVVAKANKAHQKQTDQFE